MRIKTFICLLLLVFTSFFKAQAGNITEQEARQKAVAFMKNRGHQVERNSLRRACKNTTATTVTDSYYVFNFGHDDGFVIVSGDDRTEAILGYADEGAVDENHLPDALRAWLTAVTEAMTAGTAFTPSVTIARSAIEPLIETRWDQERPYNLFCPVKTEAETSTPTVTGCVATSMAQLMYYHHYPTTAVGAIPSYTTSNGLFTLDGLAGTTFDWENMQLTYASNASNPEVAANAAVARLMQYCGWALQMNYNTATTGSSAYNASVAEVLKEYFGYDNGMDIIFRKNCSYAQWIDILYQELANSRPVILGGQSTDGGHSFICDGYDVDDYFHINWGWGGSSDGYFRLTSLVPYDQGAGGSSSLDGFSFSQEAVIGIKPATTPQAPQYCLSAEGMQLSENNASATQEIVRASSEDAFTGIPLFAELWSYRFGTANFDARVQLTDTEGNVVVENLKTDSKTGMTFNTKWAFSCDDLVIPASVPDGNYYLTVVSRPTEEIYWHTCYGLNQLRLEATISGNTLLLTAPGATMGTYAVPSCSTITTSVSPTLGYEVEVTATITGNTVNYRDALYLYVNGTRVMGKQADIPAGKTVDVHFTYTAKTAGENTLAIYAGGTKLQETTITVTPSDATNNLTLDITPTIQNLSDDKLYGNAVRVSMVISNPSTTNSYVGRLNCSLRKYANGTDDVKDYLSATVQHKIIVVEKEGNLNMSFAFDGLEVGKYYLLRITYQKEGSTLGEIPLTTRYEMGQGLVIYAADGTISIAPRTGTIEGGTAACVDLRDFGGFDAITITPSSNPNCLYLLGSEAVIPDALSSANVVKGNSAASISLLDGYAFYSPIDFTAEAINYSRTFTLAANGTSGWNTLLLPFTATSVTAGGNAVDWFHSESDTGKNFWLKTFTGDDTGHVYFDFADALLANTPYIIAVPDDRWGAAWQMTGKEIVFSASDAQVTATETGAISGNNYNFCGSTTPQSLENVYALNAGGSKFVLTDETTNEPFRAWITGSNASSLTQSLTISNGHPTVLQVPRADKFFDGNCYDLQGRLIGNCKSSNCKLPKGIYIQQGKKYFKK